MRAAHRLWSSAVVAIGFLAAGIGPALADDAVAPVQGMGGFLKGQDSNGVPIMAYKLSMNRGGLTSPDKFAWSMMVDFWWQMYLGFVGVIIKVLTWVLSFQWLVWLSDALESYSTALQAMVDRFGLVTLFLTLAAMGAVFWLMRGKIALGVYEVAMGCFIAVLAAGILANPFQLVAGSDGLLMQARNAGLELATGLAHGGNTDGVQFSMADCSGDKATVAGSPCDLVSTQLVNTFVRQPHQIINFGFVLDGGPCQGAYDDALKDFTADSDNLRKKVGECEDSTIGAAADHYADNPGPDMMLSMATLAPAVLFIGLFALVLSFGVFMAGASGLWESLKLIVTQVIGILPGAARASFWKNLAHLIVSLVEIVFSIVFLIGFLYFLQSLFAGSKPSTDGRMSTFLGIDMVLLAGTIMFWKWRKQLRTAGAARLAALLGTRPGQGPHSAAAASKLGLVGASSVASNLMWGASKLRGRGGGGDASAPAVDDVAPQKPARVTATDMRQRQKDQASAPGGQLQGTPRPLALESSANSPGTGTGGPEDPKSPKDRGKGFRRARRLVDLTATAGMAFASGGTSAAAQALGKTALKTSVKSKLADAAGKTKSRRSPATPSPSAEGYSSFKVDGQQILQPDRPKQSGSRPMTRPQGPGSTPSAAPAASQRTATPRAPGKSTTADQEASIRLRALMADRGRPVKPTPAKTLS